MKHIFIFSVLFFSISASLIAQNQTDTTLANKYFAKGETYQKSAKPDSAIICYEKAGTIFKAAGSWEPYIQCLYKSGGIHRNLKRYSEAKNQLNEAIASGEKHLGADHPLVAAAYNGLGGVYYFTGDYEKAVDYCSKALAIRVKSLGPDHPDAALSHNSLAGIYNAMSDYDSTISHYQKALSILIKNYGTERKDVADAYTNLALFYTNYDEYDPALEAYQNALDIRIKILGPDHPDVAWTYAAIGKYYEKMYRFDAALMYYQKALDVHIKLSGNAHPEIGMNYERIGEIYYFRKQDYDKAVVNYQKALDVWIRVLNPAHPKIAAAYESIGNVYTSKGDYQSALRFFLMLLDCRLKSPNPKPDDLIDAHNKIAEMYFYMSDYKSAVTHYLNILDIRIKILSPKHADLADSYNKIADMYFYDNDYDNALLYYRKLFVIAENPNYNNIAKVYRYKGEALRRTAKYDSATFYLNKAAELYGSGQQWNDYIECVIRLDSVSVESGKKKSSALTISFGKNDPRATSSYFSIGKVFEERENHDQALACYQQSLGILLKKANPLHPDALKNFQHIGNIYAAKGMDDKALEYYLKALTGLLKSKHSETEFADTLYTRLAHVFIRKGDAYKRKSDFDSSSFFYAKAGDIYKQRKAWQDFVGCLNLIEKNLSHSKHKPDSTHYLRLRTFDTDDSVTAVSYNGIGTAFYYNGSYDNSLHFLQKALGLRNKLSGADHPETAWLYFKIGNACLEKGDYDKAIECYRISHDVRMKSEPLENTGGSSSFRHMGDVYQSRADYDSALTARMNMLDIHIKSLGAGHPDLAVYYEQIGAMVESKGDYDKALNYYLQSLELIKKSDGDASIDAAKLYNHCGIIYNKKGEYDKALDAHRKALAIRLKILGTNNSSVAQSYNNMGLVFSNQGDVDKALDYYLKPLETSQESHQKATSYYNIARMHAVKGNADRALEYHLKSLAISMGTLEPYHPYIANSFNSVGSLIAGKRNFDKAYMLFNKSLGILIRSLGNDDPEVAIANFTLGNAYKAQSDYSKALGHYQRSLDIRLKTLGSVNPDVALTYHHIGEVYLQEHNYDQALMYFQKALSAAVKSYKDSSFVHNPDLSQPILSEPVLLAILKSKSVCLMEYYRQTHDLKDLDAAVKTSELAVQLIDKIRSGYQSESSKLFLGEKSYEIFETGVRSASMMYQITNDIKYKKLSFWFAEKSKAGVLLESLNDTKAKSYAGIPDSVLNIEKSLRNELIAYDKQLTEELGKGKDTDQIILNTFQNKVFELKQKYEDHVKLLEQNYPSYFSLKYLSKISSVDDIQKNLPDKSTAMIEYFLTQDSLYIYSITKKQFDVTIVPKDSLFDSKVKLMRSLLSKGRSSDWRIYGEISNELYNLLIRPLPLSSNVNQLVIVPDGILNMIPFESLVNEPIKDKERGYENLKYLIQKYSISYSYSATLYDESMLKAASKAKNEYVGFAPVFSKESNAGSITKSHAIFLSDSAGAQRGLVDRNSIVAIPGTKDEILSVYDGYDKKEKKATVYTYLQANEDNLKKEKLSDYKYIHFATHGFVNEDQPSLSGIILAQDTSITEDGVLYAGEVYGLSLDAESVILSACETGLGKQVRGEGIIGLTRGFIYAGARSVVVSLWQVADESTSKLMQDMFKRLSEDKNSNDHRAKLLRETKLKMFKNKPYAAPFYWSPFVLIGK